jgi:hypothetical protein
MTLAERVNEAPTRRKQCVGCMWLATLPPEDRKAFDELAARTDISKSNFAHICIEEGFPGGESAFKRHLIHHVPC